MQTNTSGEACQFQKKHKAFLPLPWAIQLMHVLIVSQTSVRTKLEVMRLSYDLVVTV